MYPCDKETYKWNKRYLLFLRTQHKSDYNRIEIILVWLHSSIMQVFATLMVHWIGIWTWNRFANKRGRHAFITKNEFTRWFKLVGRRFSTRRTADVNNIIIDRSKLQSIISNGQFCKTLFLSFTFHEPPNDLFVHRCQF